ncbi:GBP2 [Candida margitis]|uniref:GBP2 n=1 Tax=Candida margitis TaxID=1775924 RepID=UPI002225BFFD|nr:GBP2 [Candida margitis]KAI5970714.1 GBP2 [Candida margitis]
MSSEVEGNWDIIITSLQDICTSNESLPFDSIHDINQNQDEQQEEYYKSLTSQELTKLKQDIIDHKSNIGTAKRLIDTSMENISRLIEYLQKDELKKKQQREKEKEHQQQGAKGTGAGAGAGAGADDGDEDGENEDEVPIASTTKRRRASSASSTSSKPGSPMASASTAHHRRGESAKPITASQATTSSKISGKGGKSSGGKASASKASGGKASGATNSGTGAIGKGKKLKKVGRSYWTSKYNPSEPIYIGSEVAFKLRNRINEWIQCEVVKIIGDGIKFEIRDPEPDENNNPGHTFRANYKEVLLIPTEDMRYDLINYAYGTRVLARYPDTTTYYAAIVVGHKKDGNVRLKFDGEEEVNKECEVERRKEEHDADIYARVVADADTITITDDETKRRNSAVSAHVQSPHQSITDDFENFHYLVTKSRDHDRSPVRDRERSPIRDRSSRDGGSSSNDRDSYGRRDYGGSSYSRSSYGDRRGGGGGRGSSSYGTSRGSSSHGGSGYRGGSSRDYSSRNYGSRSSEVEGDAGYRSKTERNYDNSIFIGNIPFDSSSRDIEDIFRNDFDIVRADIVTNRGRSRGMATVEFKTKQDVTKAISKYDRFAYHGREIFVRQDYPPPDKKDFGSGRSFDRGGSRYGGNDSHYGRDSSRGGYSSGRSDYRPPLPPTTPGTEVFVGNLPFSITWQALKDIMRKAGQVARADVRLDEWGRSRGFGTVVFETPEAANAAVEMFQGYEIEGRKLDTRHGRTANPPASGEASAAASSVGGKKNTEFTEGVTGDGEEANDTIYVENLPFSTQNDDLFDLFETIGRVTQAEIQYQEDGRASGNAVVQFEIVESATTSINELNGYEYGGRRLKISYKKL